MNFKVELINGQTSEFSGFVGFFSKTIDKEVLTEIFRGKELNLEDIYTLEIYDDEVEVAWGGQFVDFPNLKKLTLKGTGQVRLNCFNFEGSAIEVVTVTAGEIWFNDGSFSRAENLLSVNLSGRILDGHCKGSLAELLFQNCVNLRYIRGYYQGEKLMPGVFNNCKSLEQALDFRVKELGYRTFAECSSLKTIHLHNGLKSLGYGAFENCISLEDIYIPDTVDSLGSNTFSGCSSLKTIHLPKEITIIPESFLKNCSKLQKCFLPDGIKTIKAKAFEGCLCLQSPFMPSNIERIEERAFWGCESIGNIYLPPSVSFIGEDAFGNCPNLVIKGKSGSYAEMYANKFGINFIIL